MQGKRLYPFIKMPSRSEFVNFMSFAGPVFLFILCKILFYSGMTMAVTSSGNNVSDTSSNTSYLHAARLVPCTML